MNNAKHIGYATINMNGRHVVGNLYDDTKILVNGTDTGIRYDIDGDGSNDDPNVLEVAGL